MKVKEMDQRNQEEIETHNNNVRETPTHQKKEKKGENHKGTTMKKREQQKQQRQSFRAFLSSENEVRVSFEKAPQSELRSWLIIFHVLFFRRVRKRSKENSGGKAMSNRKTNSLISKTL